MPGRPARSPAPGRVETPGRLPRFGPPPATPPDGNEGRFVGGMFVGGRTDGRCPPAPPPTLPPGRVVGPARFGRPPPDGLKFPLPPLGRDGRLGRVPPAGGREALPIEGRLAVCEVEGRDAGRCAAPPLGRAPPPLGRPPPPPTCPIDGRPPPCPPPRPPRASAICAETNSPPRTIHTARLGFANANMMSLVRCGGYLPALGGRLVTVSSKSGSRAPATIRSLPAIE